MMFRSLLLTVAFVMAAVPIETEQTPVRPIGLHRSNAVHFDEAYVADLADRYLAEGATTADWKEFRREVSELDARSQEQFVENLIALQYDEQNASPQEALDIHRMRAMCRLLLAHGLNLFDVDPEVLDDLIRMNMELFTPGQAVGGEATPSSAACIYPYVSCSTASFPISVYDANMSPVNYYTVSSYDRKSNSSCEELACDYRFKFNPGSQKKYISAKSSAGMCVIDKSGDKLPSSYSGGVQYVLTGYGTTVFKCWTSAGTLQKDLLLVK